MERLSDEVLVHSYKKALDLELNRDFVYLLEIELTHRNLLSILQMNRCDKNDEM